MPISEAIKTALAEGTGFFVTLIRVTAKESKGGDVIAYCMHTRNIVYDGTTFLAMPFEPSKMSQASGVSVDNATVTHLLGEMFTRLNIQGGKWSGARIELLAVDLFNLADGPARRHFGRVGDVTTRGKEATTEFRGLMQMLNQEIGDRTSRRCRYTLGDADCTLDLAAFTFPGTVVTVYNNQRLTVTVNQANGYFKYGKIVFTSGLNDGLEMETINNTGSLITLFLPMPGLIQIGDTFDLIAGDDKKLSTCHAKFANAINFGGEDSIPKREDLYTFPE